jgi:nucleoside transporter
LAGLFLIQGMALGMWMVPLSPVLDAHGLHAIKPFAFAASALAAFVSPLIFGAMADRHFSAVKVLRGLSLATAAAMALASLAIHQRWNPWLTLGIIQLHALCASPSFSLSSTIVLSRLADAHREFGPIRAMATLGWMGGCWIVSALRADSSTLAGFSGAVAWLGVAAFTLALPAQAPLKSPGKLTWTQRLGLDALSLLKQRDHRVVFMTTSLLCIPLAAFYPYAPVHLRALGFPRTSAWMSLGQVTEVISMVSLSALLLRFRLKWVLSLGLSFGVIRFVLSALDRPGWLLAGVLLHGCSFALVFITAQIYLEERVDSAWRARAQALMTLMNSGVGNLLGYLGTGWWYSACAAGGQENWQRFWSGLALAVMLVFAHFLIAYRGRGGGLHRPGASPVAA